MDPSKKEGWNREILSQRNCAASETAETKDLTDAEFHLTVGRIIQNRLRRGQNVEGYADKANMKVDQCHQALVYANSSPGLIFRALVEDWSWERIQKEILQCQSPQGGKQEC